jgi:uncharacterized membrane protein
LKENLLKLLVVLMGLSYVWIGCQHFINPSFFLKIVPPYLAFHLELVYLSGGFEIIFGLGLLFKKTRFYASWGLVFLLIAVYPANIYLAFNEIPQEAINVSSFMASWVRLPIQFVLIWLAYKSSKL